MCILKPASHPRSESCPVFSSALLSRAWLWGTRTRSVLPRSGGQPFQCWLLQCNRKKGAWNESARAPAGRAPVPVVGHGSGARAPEGRAPVPAPRRDALRRTCAPGGTRSRAVVGHGSGVPAAVPGTPPGRDVVHRPVASRPCPPAPRRDALRRPRPGGTRYGARAPEGRATAHLRPRRDALPCQP